MTEVRKSKKRRREELRYGVGAGTPLQAEGIVALPPYVFGPDAGHAVTSGTTLQLQFGKDIVALTPCVTGPNTEGDVLSVSEDGQVQLPPSAQRALALNTGDLVVIWNEGRRVFIEKMPRVPPSFPRTAAVLDQRRPRGGRWPTKGELVVAHLRHAGEIGVAASSSTWSATSDEGISGQGRTITEALDALESELLSQGRGEYWDEVSSVMEPWDAGKGHAVSLRPMFPPEVEDTLDRFRKRWFATNDKDREDLAVRPVVLDLLTYGVALEDVAWILELPPKVVESYTSGSTG